MQLNKRREGVVDLAFGSGLKDMELHPFHPRGLLYGLNHLLHALGPCVGVHKQSDRSGLRNQLGQQLDPLGHQLGCQDTDACKVAFRPRETGDQAFPNWVAGDEDDRDRRGGVFRRTCGYGTAAALDHVHLAGDKIPRQLRQPVLATFCPAVFDRYILPFRIAVFAQSLAERSDKTGRTGQATPSSGTRSPASLSAARERLVRPSCRSPALGAARGVSSEHHVGAPGVTHVLPVRRRIRLSLVRFFEDATYRGPT